MIQSQTEYFDGILFTFWINNVDFSIIFLLMKKLSCVDWFSFSLHFIQIGSHSLRLTDYNLWWMRIHQQFLFEGLLNRCFSLVIFLFFTIYLWIFFIWKDFLLHVICIRQQHQSMKWKKKCSKPNSMMDKNQRNNKLFSIAPCLFVEEFPFLC